MKRPIAASVALAVLAAPTIAGAGHGDPATKTAARVAPMAVKFTAIKQVGKPVGVDEFRVRRLPITCTEGPARLKFNLKAPGDNNYFPVDNKGRFQATRETATHFVGVTGKFVDNDRKVRGRVKGEGNFPQEGLTNCLGKEGYTAG